MILDGLTKVSAAQALTTTAASTSFIDTKAAGDSYKGAFVHFKVDTSVTATGTGTVQMVLQTSATSTFASTTTLVDTGAIAKATLVAGYEKSVRIPAGALRYIRAYYTTAAGGLSTGAVTCVIALDVPTVIA